MRKVNNLVLVVLTICITVGCLSFNTFATSVENYKQRANEISAQIDEKQDNIKEYTNMRELAERFVKETSRVGIGGSSYIVQDTYNKINKYSDKINELNKDIEELRIKMEEYKVYERFKYVGDFKLTGYCPCYKCSEGWGTKTASGAKATEGVTIAADTKKLPMGTKIFIEGVGFRTVQDVGGGVKGNRIDIFVNNHSSCYKDAYNRNAKVYIISE